jgi:hypothetical protein
MVTSTRDKDNFASWDVQAASQAADHYSKAFGVACRVIDPMGRTLYLASDTDQTGSVH